MATDLQDIIVSSSVKAFNSGLAHGVVQERQRIIELLTAKKVLRVDALGSLVFVNCDTLEVEYLSEATIEGKAE